MVIEKLNSAVNLGEKSFGFSAKPIDLKFYQGDASDTLKDLVSSIAPCGKVAFITKFDTNLLYCTRFAKAVKSVGATMTTVVLEDTASTIENASVLFSIPDEVRLVITADTEILDLVYYFANLRKIPVVVIPKSLDVEGILKTKIYIQSGDKVDGVIVKPSLHIVIDKTILSGTEHKGFAFIMSKLVSLIDYRISHALIKSPVSKKAFDMVKQSVLSTYGVLKLDEDKRFEVILYNAFQIEIASMITKGQITDSSAQTIAVGLSKAKDRASASLMFAKNILKLYLATCDIKFDLSALTDLNALSDLMQDKTGVDFSVYLKNLKSQVKLAIENGEKAFETLKSLKDEISSFVNLFAEIEKTFISLGGKTPEIIDYKFSLIHSGDHYIGANTMTLIRELGLIK